MTEFELAKLKELPIEQLSEIAEVAHQAIQAKQESELLEAWRLFVVKAKEYNMSIEEALSVCYKTRRQNERTIPIKYKDPANENNVWSGRGKTPCWLADYLKNGNKKEDFLMEG